MIHRIVTGAQGFLGLALTRSLRAAPGYLLAVDRVPGKEVEAVDVTDIAFHERLRQFLIGATRAELYNAAGSVPDLACIVDIPPTEFQLVLNDNLVVSYATARAFAEAASALKVTASITFLGSVGAARSHRYKIAYDAAMAGTEALARGFALEYASAGITTRVAALGPIADSRTSIEDGGRSGDLVSLVPARRYPTVDEVATAVIAFGGSAFDIATGAVVPLDAGLTQQLRPADVERSPVPTHRTHTGTASGSAG